MKFARAKFSASGCQKSLPPTPEKRRGSIGVEGGKEQKATLPQFYEPLWSKFVSHFRQPIESFFKWLNEKPIIKTHHELDQKKAYWFIAVANPHLLVYFSVSTLDWQ